MPIDFNPDTVLDYATRAEPRHGTWRLIRCGIGLLFLQAMIIVFCEYEAQNFGRTVHGSWDRYAVHTTIRLELADGRVALAMFLLALANLLFVGICLYRDRRTANLAKRVCVAFPFALLPLAIQFAIIPLYASFCYE